MSINRFVLSGYIGRTPVTHYGPAGSSYAVFTLAVKNTYPNVPKLTEQNQSQRKDQTGPAPGSAPVSAPTSYTYIPIACTGKVAELSRKYLAPGQAVVVEGTILTRTLATPPEPTTVPRLLATNLEFSRIQDPPLPLAALQQDFYTTHDTISDP